MPDIDTPTDPAPTDPAPADPPPAQVPPPADGAPGTAEPATGDPDPTPTPTPGEDWKARSRQHEDRAKANRKAADDALARAAAADERAQGHEATLQALRKALDPNGSSTEDDPKVLAEKAAAERDQAAQERDAAKAELAAARVERIAETAARKGGADVDALLDSRGFAAALAKLDPADADLADHITQAVAAALDGNPRLKATPAPPSRSVPDPGAARDTTGQLTRAELAGMTPDQITEARKAGRLKSLGVGP